ncbi:hypothetical protein BDV18DRAFT_128997 [Aspergillus unguis]
MDLTQLHLQASHPYTLDPELSSGSYGSAIGIPQLPRSLNPGFDLQSTLNPNSQADQQQLPWPQRVANEVRDLLLLLAPDGTVHYVSPSCRAIMGFDTANLEHGYLSLFIHDEDKPVFARELRECIADARPFRCHFRMYKVDNSTCLMDAYGHPHFSGSASDPNANSTNDQLHQQQQLCHGVFLICRPYHTQSTQLLDSFLEHKLENIRLKERIAQLKREEENDINAAAQQTKVNHVPSSAAHRPVPQSNKGFSAGLERPSIPAEDNESSDTLDNANDLDLSQARAALRGEGSSHLTGIELLTGLFLSEGERAQGLSTGIPQAHLYNSAGGDRGQEQQHQQQHQHQQQVVPENEPRKRLKGEYKCADCGTSDSPEWRKGPDGPKTLCNACGLRWAKLEKKRQDLG